MQSFFWGIFSMSCSLGISLIIWLAPLAGKMNQIRTKRTSPGYLDLTLGQEPYTLICILFPIASLRCAALTRERRALGIFFDWLFENKEILNGSQNVLADYWRENITQLWLVVFKNGGHERFGRKFFKGNLLYFNKYRLKCLKCTF